MAANRSEVPDPKVLDKAKSQVERLKSRDRRDDLEFNELSINLRISYKTVLLVVVVFNVVEKIVNGVDFSNVL
ncbi:TPA_asm: hypothetical protein [ssRNA phage Zoerhiza.4_13]|uniref:Uncharacterized protein n=2 Tax=Leviviricetes TaxID=2842243 RepID=A0A8S5L2K2_9VIRU|nr:hypothetical protein QIQ11_gp3 [ssRNA phage Zoerhiza.4_13]QDH87316.1 MAG: hypothetical protein H4Rhizo441764_000002 [Leviviridae sp.]DAD51856.1 TPA_asm: hypothetical protein [ssRNA phage Zoerhiza.4_13]